MQRQILALSVSAACAQIGREWREAKERKAFEELKVHERHAAIERERALLEKIAGTPSGAPA